MYSVNPGQTNQVEQAILKCLAVGVPRNQIDRFRRIAIEKALELATPLSEVKIQAFHALYELWRGGVNLDSVSDDKIASWLN